MKKIAMLVTGMLLGINFCYGLSADVLPTVSAKVEDNGAVECLDNEIFKVARLRPESVVKEYRIAKYDTLNLMVSGYTDGIDGVEEITVDADGMARLPYSGNVKLSGLTLNEARDVLYDRLSSYFKLTDFNVSMKEYAPRQVYVMGNVISPGVKDMPVDSMNVYAAVSVAGGVDKRGRSKHIQLLRQIDGVLYYREVNIDAFVKKRDLSQNIELEEGDIIYVPDSGKVVFSEDIAPYINIYGTYRALTRD